MTPKEKELLKKKKNLQQVKNTIQKLEGIQVLDIDEKSIFDYIDADAYQQKTTPDSVLTFTADISKIVEWMKENTPFSHGDEVFFSVYEYFVHVKIIDLDKTYRTAWEVLGDVVIFSKDLLYCYEFGNDSRDEWNYVFDKFIII